jgi:alpha-mannosidase
MQPSNPPQVLHMIGNGHIDPMWLWRLSEGLAEIRATFRSALDRMREYPNFKFTATSAFFFDWIERTDPAMFEEIRERVREGRWELAGGWWIEPDLNCPGGESLVRQGLYGQRYFRDKFGKFSTVGFNPDAFGHPGMLPQILRKQRLQYYAYLRPSVDAIGRPVEREYPGGTTFRWRSADGSEIVTTNILLQYESSGVYPVGLDRLPGHPALNPGQVNVLACYGVGNHGGGPTRANIETIEQYKNEKARSQLSTLESYFKARTTEPDADSLPVVDEELQYHARGCYSTHSRIKRLTRYCEFELLAAERLATIDLLVNQSPYPSDRLEHAWKRFLFNQFHDILAGTSVESACDEACEELGRCRVDAREIMESAVQRFAAQADTSAAGTTLFAFNPLPWEVTATLHVPAHELRRLRTHEGLEEIGVTDSDGTPVPVQPCHGEYAGGDQLAFTATLPPLGYACYQVLPAQPVPMSGRMLTVTDTVLENEWWRIAFDSKTGAMVSLLDKSKNFEVLTRGNVFAISKDDSDTWGHTVQAFDEPFAAFTATQVAKHESGVIYASIRLELARDQSTIRQHYRIYRDSPRIESDIEIDWRGSFQILKLRFDTRVDQPTATYEVPYGHCERPPSGDEEPGQCWFDCSGEINGASYGLAIANDAKFGYDIRNGRMGITILRCPPYAWHDPEPHDPYSRVAIMDQGIQRLKLRLLPHAGDWRDTSITREGPELVTEPKLHMEYAHKGHLPPRESFGYVSPDSVDFTVLKKAEDVDAIVVRLVERNGRPTDGTLHLLSIATPIDFSIGAFEIQTWRIGAGSGETKHVDLLET